MVSCPGRDGLGLGILAGVATVVWIVGATNAINLIDGLDGLAGGVVAIISPSLVVCALLQGHRFTVVLLAGMAGACLGFLRHNWEPARIFLGDAGSLTVGFLLAIAAVQASIKASTAVAILVPILALGLPVMDTLLVMIARFLGLPGAPLRARLLRLGRRRPPARPPSPGRAMPQPSQGGRVVARRDAGLLCTGDRRAVYPKRGGRGLAGGS